MAGDVGPLYLSRAAVGLGEGISPPAAVDIIAKRVPVNERSRATTFVFGSMHAGTISGLLVAPLLIRVLGWPSVFVAFGAVGVVWCIWFERFFSLNRERLDEDLQAVGAAAGDSSTVGDNGDNGHNGRVPWGAIASSTPMRALTYIHFCNNWAQYSILAWLPTFYKDELGMELHEAAQLALLPALAGIAVSFVAAPLADNLVERGVGVTRVRKLMQSVAFAAPAACMLACVLRGEESPHLVTWLLPLGIGFQAFSLAGLYCNHQDISPKYASILSGATHLVASLPGVFGVPFTGWLLDHTGSWSFSLFVPCLFFYLTGIGVYAKWGSAEQVDFNLKS